MAPRCALFLALAMAPAAAAGVTPLHDACVLNWCPVRENGALATPSPSDLVPALITIAHRNLDRLAAIYHEVSDPAHARYGQYMDHDELYQLIGNPNGTAAVGINREKWLLNPQAASLAAVEPNAIPAERASCRSISRWSASSSAL